MSLNKFVVGTAIAAFLTMGTLAAQTKAAQTKAEAPKAINPPGKKVSPNFSNGILVGKTLYVAGQQGTDSAGHLLTGVAAQTQGALKNIQAILEAAGYTMNDVVSINVYLSDIRDFSAMNQVYVSMLPNPKPARTTIQADELVDGARVEISAIAAKP